MHRFPFPLRSSLKETFVIYTIICTIFAAYLLVPRLRVGKTETDMIKYVCVWASAFQENIEYNP